MTIPIDGMKWWCVYNTDVSIDNAHGPQSITEMNAVVLLSLVAAVVAEAPYNLPRPGPQAPIFNYPRAPPPPVIHNPHVPQHQSNGYNYQRPSQPAFAQPGPAPQPQYYQPIARPAPQPLPVYPIQHQPQPIQYQPQPIQHPQPLPIQHYPQPQPQPIYIPQPVAPQPQPGYQPQPILPPSTSYGIPQLPAPVQPIQPLPAIIAQPQPAPIQYHQQQQLVQEQQQVQQQQVQLPQQQQVSQGYSYPQAQPAQYSQLSLQSQQASSAASSYQADSIQYNNAQSSQVHGGVLDEAVVSRVQSIIKDSEHSSAKASGYASLVSGVSLGEATPSVEVLSFVHNSPISGVSSQSSQASQSSSSVQAQSSSSDYSLPSDAIRSGFVPQDKPASSYGVPH